MKIVGVVIPIYNVEKYLKECLDSVINQTYIHLEIILVNDGSTDENSLNIAKEYTLKDKRITLFDKKNGGHSSAKNVGIEYFSGEYKLKNTTQNIKENSLIEFKIEGNNPYEVYTVYKSFKAFNNEEDIKKFTYPYIDYIIFLDSDDYWELNCIEECVPRMDGVDVLWFDYKFLVETKSAYDVSLTYLERYKFKDGIISSSDWAKKYPYSGYTWFAFIWNGMINFNFLKKIKLKFILNVSNIDIYFGTILFCYAKYIYVMNRKLYIYRVRLGSETQCDFTEKSITPNMRDIYKYFNYDVRSTIEYHRLSSNALMSIEIFDYLNKNKCDIENDLDRVLEDRINTTLDTILQYIDNDPRGCIEKIPPMFYVRYINNLKSRLPQINISAKFKVKNHLSYRLGKILIINSKSFIGILCLPIYLLSEVISYKQNKRINQGKNNFINLPLEAYPDFEEALKIKNYLSYKLGDLLIHSFSNWYKGKLILLPFSMFRCIKEWKIKSVDNKVEK
ncbi:glycosyltransferase family 2 protein [Campylobacter coli]|nr:glycosyltransferase family 2 protein [Campylobacter coli]ECR3230697.1 glycosyltransferase family 2 protein [Campylobacter coli]